MNGCVIGPQQVGDSSVDPLLEVANAIGEQKLYSLMKEWRRESTCSKDTSLQGGE